MLPSQEINGTYDNSLWTLPFENEYFNSLLEMTLPRYPNLGYVIGFVYVCVIFGLRKWMENRERYSLTALNFTWNLLLLLINVGGVLRMWRHIEAMVGHESIYGSLCVERSCIKDAACFFWIAIFPLIKVLELGDTIFIVLQKRELVTFYWTHHLCAVLVTWYVFPTYATVLRWFAWLIYLNHIPIYAIATIKSLKIKLSKMFSIGLLISEVSHMLCGILLCSAIYYYVAKGLDCNISISNVSILMFAYTFCFILSAALLGRYLIKSKSKNQSSQSISTVA